MKKEKVRERKGVQIAIIRKGSLLRRTRRRKIIPKEEIDNTKKDTIGTFLPVLSILRKKTMRRAYPAKHPIKRRKSLIFKRMIDQNGVST
ncbi:MAG: hypothetical protein HXS52_11020 [Theionarchaea archaeon]|nr:hypothetical protein [Theionarchaea archaeon]